mmetsp:Transcript_112455/g.363093  ORF Transcript_112455/g.363093 Transcript_112455/m.363093 type:complete len:306 (+) Transcript_112455:213-1130(+)
MPDARVLGSLEMEQPLVLHSASCLGLASQEGHVQPVLVAHHILLQLLYMLVHAIEGCLKLLTSVRLLPEVLRQAVHRRGQPSVGPGELLVLDLQAVHAVPQGAEIPQLFLLGAVQVPQIRQGRRVPPRLRPQFLELLSHARHELGQPEVWELPACDMLHRGSGEETPKTLVATRATLDAKRQSWYHPVIVEAQGSRQLPLQRRSQLRGNRVQWLSAQGPQLHVGRAPRLGAHQRDAAARPGGVLLQRPLAARARGAQPAGADGVRGAWARRLRNSAIGPCPGPVLRRRVQRLLRPLTPLRPGFGL